MAANSSRPNGSRLKSSDSFNNCRRISGLDPFMDLSCVRYSVLKQELLTGKISSDWPDLSHLPGWSHEYPQMDELKVG